MLDRFVRGVGIALRSGAAPVVLGARLARQEAEAPGPDVPVLRRGFATTSKIVLDELFFASELALGALLPLRDRARVAAELAQAIAFLEARGWLDDPRGYHVAPPPLSGATSERAQTGGLAYEHLRWESGFEPWPGAPGRERWLGLAPNRGAHAWILRHRGPERPWLLCLPGYRMGHPRVDFAGFRAGWLHRRLGLNVAIPVLPLHGPRRVGRRGGDGFFSGDFVDTLHAQAQAVWDARRLATWLFDQGAPAVALHGVSLGGYTTALLASLQDGLACVIAGIPAADFVRLLRSHVPGFVLRLADGAGLGFDRVERLLRVVSPFAFEPRVPPARRYLYAGVGDRLTPPEHAHALWQHWGRPRVVWYQGSHVSFLWEPAVKALLYEALINAGLLRHSEG
jgi:hypothetical protein